MVMSVNVAEWSFDQDSAKCGATHDYNLGVYLQRPPQAMSS